MYPNPWSSQISASPSAKGEALRKRVSMTVRPALSSPCRTTAPPNVNAYDSRLKQWMHRCHAVATKYSENYLGCRRMIERYRQNISPAACLHEAVGRWQPQ